MGAPVPMDRAAGELALREATSGPFVADGRVVRSVSGVEVARTTHPDEWQARKDAQAIAVALLGPVEDLDSQLGDMREELEDVEREASSANSKLEDAEEELRGVKRELTAKKKTIERLERELAEAKEGAPA